jgi:AI-2 transport protein TqsA
METSPSPCFAQVVVSVACPGRLTLAPQGRREGHPRRGSRRRQSGGGVVAWSDESGRTMCDAAGSVTPRSAVPRALLILVGLAAAFIVVAGMRTLQDLIGPVFLALVLTVVVHPVRKVISRRLPDWAATVICLVVMYAVLLGLALAIAISAARFATLLPTYQEKFTELVDDATSWLNGLGVGTKQLNDISGSFELSDLSGVVTSILSSAVSLVSDLAFIIAVGLFMTIDGRAFPRNLAEVAKARPRLVGALTDFARGTRRYLWVSSVFGLIVAVLDTTALYLLDIPAPVLWGLLAFLTNYIPNIGFVIGLIPPAVLGLLEGGPGLMLTVIAVYCVLNVIIQSGIQPKVVGDAVGLSTTLTFVSLVFWAWVLGPLGALLAIPLSLLTKALLIDADPATQWLSPLVSNVDAEAPSKVKASRRSIRNRHDLHDVDAEGTQQA